MSVGSCSPTSWSAFLGLGSRGLGSRGLGSRRGLLGSWSLLSSRGLVGSLGRRCGAAVLRSSFRLQRREQPRHLGRQRVEGSGRTSERSLHSASELGEQHLPGLQVGELDDLGRGELLAVQHATLYYQLWVGLGKVPQALGGLHYGSADKRDGRRALEQVGELVGNTRLGGGDLRQRVLDDRELG